MRARSIPVAITLGDPCGIGPEVAVAAALGGLRRSERGAAANLLLVGDLGAAQVAAERLGASVRLRACSAAEAAAALAARSHHGLPAIPEAVAAG